ncbi:hypothetical protein Y032_0041g361 [Ancylostoma ceylanicum]|uniref:SCP domain-containing protein n=1 Tax=Ancylostoma ceylanicum TaxID=53326 RepID=A0A016UH48_9BILA|nr:hypothetical protein Y032_0041g361 [Ancylostoma ceylanicum]
MNTLSILGACKSSGAVGDSSLFNIVLFLTDAIFRNPFHGIAVTAYILLDVPVSAATEFGCKDTLISDKWREAVLNFHNSNRKRISQGLQLSKNGKVMPGAKDMNQLVRCYYVDG